MAACARISVSENDAGTYGSSIYFQGTSTGTMSSSIVYADTSVAALYFDGSSSFSGSYNNVYKAAGSAYSGISDPTGTSGNLSVDPVFSNPSADDWSLLSTSPSIDAGAPSNSDSDGSTTDQGAFGGPASD